MTIYKGALLAIQFLEGENDFKEEPDKVEPLQILYARRILNLKQEKQRLRLQATLTTLTGKGPLIRQFVTFVTKIE